MSNDFDALTPAQKLELADLVIAQMAATSTVPFKPVDVANMPTLDAGDGSWVDEIVQLMPGHAVSAGAPDPANNKGLFNWPLQQLAQRTVHLLAGLVPLANEAEVLAGQVANKSVSPALLAKALGKTGDGLPLHLDLSNDGQSSQNIAKDVPVRCNNMVDAGGNAGALWNGHRFTVDANSLGVYGILNRLNVNNEEGEGAQTWKNGVAIMDYQLGASTGSHNVMPFTHFVLLTDPGDYIEFYHYHKSSGSRTNNGSAAQVYRLLPYQPAV